MSFRLIVAARAEAQIEAAAEWWFENRPGAPVLLSEEVERAFLTISRFPSAGEAIGHRRIAGLHRILLSRISYHLYYSVNDAEATVEVLAMWHTSRRRGPAL